MKWPYISLLLILKGLSVNAQLPPWNTKFVVYHPDGYTDTLWIGCDENATGGYDEGLDIIDTTFQYPLAIRGYSEEIENDSAFGTCVNLKRDIRNFGYPAVFTFYILNDEIGAEENIYLGWDSASCIYNYGSIKINYIKVSSSNGYLEGIDNSEILLFGINDFDSSDVIFHYNDSIKVISESSAFECSPSDPVVKLQLEVNLKDYTLEIPGQTLNQTTKIYPSLTTDFLTIEISVPKMHLYLYNSLGRLVKLYNLESTKNRVSLNDLVDGIYYLEIHDQNRCVIYSQTVIKQQQ